MTLPISPTVALSIAGKGAKLASNAFGSARADSLISFTEMANLRPVVLMDPRAAMLPEASDAVKTLASLYIAYYLQALAIDSEISGIKILKKLEKFSTDRDALSITKSFLTSMESLPIGLDFVGHNLGLEAYLPAESISLEAKSSYEQDLERRINEANLAKAVATATAEPSGSWAVKDLTKLTTDITNLAVGKLLEVKVETNGVTSTIPISFRQRVIGMDSSTIVDLYALGAEDRSFRTRFRQFKAGELEFWRDIVYTMDKIDEYYENALKDKTGYYKNMASRQLRHKLSGFAGDPSLGMISSAVVLHEQTKDDLEQRIGGSLSDFRVRQNIFEKNMLMLMMVLDPEWTSVKIYHRGIPEVTELDFKAIKDGGKTDDKMIDVLKAFQLGQAPGRLN